MPGANKRFELTRKLLIKLSENLKKIQFNIPQNEVLVKLWATGAGIVVTTATRLKARIPQFIQEIFREIHELIVHISY